MQHNATPPSKPTALAPVIRLADYLAAPDPTRELLRQHERAADAYVAAVSAHQQLALKHAAELAPLRDARVARGVEADRAFHNARFELLALFRRDPEHPLLVELRAKVEREPKGKCCKWSVRRFCVCADAYECPLHGSFCVGGTHD